MWIMLFVLSAVVALVWFFRPRNNDLGSVSPEWLAEYRQDAESQRS